MTEYLLLFFIATAGIVFFARPLSRELRTITQSATGGGITIQWDSE